jgi:NADH dehydrogenase
VILIAGGTGRLGTLVVKRLTAGGLPVRVLTRDPARAAHLEGLPVEVVEGDVRDRASLDPALAGVVTVVSAVHGFAGPGHVSPASVDRDGNINLIDAAAAVDAAVVMMSVVGASANSPMELFRMKHSAEDHLRASGTPWTIVRATSFLELWISLLEQTAGRSGRPLVFGRGHNPVNFVSVTDVSALVERVVTDASARGCTLEIGGPQNLTFNQLAAAVQERARRTKKPRHVPRAMLQIMATVLKVPKPELARQARAALVLDRADLTFDPSPIHRRYPGLPATAAADLLVSPATVDG